MALLAVETVKHFETFWLVLPSHIHAGLWFPSNIACVKNSLNFYFGHSFFSSSRIVSFFYLSADMAPKHDQLW